MNTTFLLVGREEESGPDSDLVPSSSTLRVKWQEKEEGLRLVCGEVRLGRGLRGNGMGPDSRSLGARGSGPWDPASEGHSPSSVPECSLAWFWQPWMR